MAPYEYSALDEEASEIRLLTLLPGRFEDDIFITMETVVLTKEHTPQYEALSYVWSPEENPIDISVKAGAAKHSETFSLLDHSIEQRLDTCILGTISVTQNLATALSYLRKEAESRVVWIDAICVNQQDTAERNHQVKRMAAVYSMANPVIVWLGPESHNSTSALRAIDALGSLVQVNWKTYTLTSVSTRELITRSKNPFDDETWESVGDLLDRPWFKRLWIRQEVRLAGEAYLFCGNEAMLWESLRNAIFYLRRAFMPKGISHLIDHCYEMSNYGGRTANTTNGLERELQSARSASCTDPRDKIFAILSLADKWDTTGLHADYTKPVEAVFQDLVLHYTSDLELLDILAHCELRDDTGGMQLPTWVPNWAVSCLTRRLKFAKSCLDSESRVRYQGGRILAATGVHVAVIKSVESLPQPTAPYISFSGSELEDGIRALIIPKLESLSLSEREASDTSLCRTFCCDTFAERGSPPYADLFSFEVSQKYMHRMIDTTRDTALDDSQESRHFLTRVMSSIRGRSFFTTLDGHIGLAPIAAKPDDEVCTILGCQSPLILRPCGDGFHKVVGECYIDGFMDGAACLGPLPSNWQMVERYFEEYSTYYDAYFNQQTGEFHIEDPRRGPLPAGWYIFDYKMKNAYNVYANDEIGERNWCDPRMRPEALKARGADVREYRLV